jgi:hypothetical protein
MRSISPHLQGRCTCGSQRAWRSLELETSKWRDTPPESLYLSTSRITREAQPHSELEYNI